WVVARRSGPDARALGRAGPEAHEPEGWWSGGEDPLSAAVLTALAGYQPAMPGRERSAARVRRVTSTSRSICSISESTRANFKLGRWNATNASRTTSP